MELRGHVDRATERNSFDTQLFQFSLFFFTRHFLRVFGSGTDFASLTAFFSPCSRLAASIESIRDVLYPQNFV
jgi:hypothetical protein